jgi:hypothetical protein
MVLPSIDFSVTPINLQSKLIEERFFYELINKSIDSIAMAEVYVQYIPNIRSESKPKPISSRMAKFKEAGLIGCLNDSGITSSNYKEIMYGSIKTDSNI